MATNLMKTSKKLIQALNNEGYKLTFSMKQFIGRDNLSHNYYSINRAEWNDERKRYNHYEVYSSASMVRIVLFLRDMWFKHNGWELPTDQELWNKIRSDLQEKEVLDTNG